MKRMPIWAGNAITITGTILGVVLSIYTPYLQFPARPLSALTAFLTLWFFPHTLTHYITGTMLGIRFRYYFIGRSSIRKIGGVFSMIAGRLPVLGIRVEVESLRRARPVSRLIMFSSGAIASSLLPYIPSTILYSADKLWGTPLLALATLNLAFTMYFSPKVGDIRRGLDSLRM